MRTRARWPPWSILTRQTQLDLLLMILCVLCHFLSPLPSLPLASLLLLPAGMLQKVPAPSAQYRVLTPEEVLAVQDVSQGASIESRAAAISHRRPAESQPIVPRTDHAAQVGVKDAALPAPSDERRGNDAFDAELESWFLSKLPPTSTSSSGRDSPDFRCA